MVGCESDVLQALALAQGIGPGLATVSLACWLTDQCRALINIDESAGRAGEVRKFSIQIH